MGSPSARCPSATACGGLQAFQFEVDNCHTLNSVFLASGKEAGYSRSRPAIAWFSPAPALGHHSTFWTSTRGLTVRHIDANPGITVADARRWQLRSQHLADCNEPSCELITGGRKGNP